MKTLSLIALTIALGGCAKGQINVAALDPTIRPVMERHDNFVRASPELSQTEKETFLRSTTLLRAVLDEASKP